MDDSVVCSVAFLASMLTFFSGFGLGTLLLPAFVVFSPVGVRSAVLDCKKALRLFVAGQRAW